MNRDDDDDRREFLKNCGRFAAVTPPVLTALLSTTMTSKAIAHSSGGVHYWNHHEHGHKHERGDD